METKDKKLFKVKKQFKIKQINVFKSKSDVKFEVIFERNTYSNMYIFYNEKDNAYRIRKNKTKGNVCNEAFEEFLEILGGFKTFFDEYYKIIEMIKKSNLNEFIIDDGTYDERYKFECFLNKNYSFFLYGEMKNIILKERHGSEFICVGTNKKNIPIRFYDDVFNFELYKEILIKILNTKKLRIKYLLTSKGIKQNGF